MIILNYLFNIIVYHLLKISFLFLIFSYLTIYQNYFDILYLIHFICLFIIHLNLLYIILLSHHFTQFTKNTIINHPFIQSLLFYSVIKHSYLYTPFLIIYL